MLRIKNGSHVFASLLTARNSKARELDIILPLEIMHRGHTQHNQSEDV